MHFSKLLPPLLALLLAALCTASTQTEEICKTEFTSKPPASIISTTQTETVRLLAYRKVTSTPFVTVTAKASTFTSTIRVTHTATATTTLSECINVHSSTSTVFATITTTSVSTSVESDTVTQTLTETPSTVIVPTPAGFTPIAVVNPGSAKRALAIRGGQKSSPPANNAQKIIYTYKDGHFECSPQKYPSKVVCEKTIEIISTSTITYTAHQTVTKYITPPAKTVSVTITYTTTTTTIPIETILSTSTLTSTVLVTSASTTTTTATITELVGAAPTVYEACSTNNIISSVNGVGIDQGGFLVDTLLQASTDDAQACCVLCQTTAACGGTLFLGGQCVLAGDQGTCDGSLVTANFFTGTGDFPGVEVSNGPCGQQTFV